MDELYVVRWLIVISVMVCNGRLRSELGKVQAYDAASAL